MDVLIQQAEHLGLLKRAHAAVRRDHEHPQALFSAHRVLGSAAGVAAGRAKNIERLTPPRQFVFEQIAQQLHGQVFESERRAVGQGFKKKAVFKLSQRNDFRRTKHGGGVGLVADGPEVSRRNVVDIQRQNSEGQLGIT